jgi:hypothetical protein
MGPELHERPNSPTPTLLGRARMKNRLSETAIPRAATVALDPVKSS